MIIVLKGIVPPPKRRQDWRCSMGSNGNSLSHHGGGSAEDNGRSPPIGTRWPGNRRCGEEAKNSGDRPTNGIPAAATDASRPAGPWARPGPGLCISRPLSVGGLEPFALGKAISSLGAGDRRPKRRRRPTAPAQAMARRNASVKGASNSRAFVHRRRRLNPSARLNPPAAEGCRCGPHRFFAKSQSVFPIVSRT